MAFEEINPIHRPSHIRIDMKILCIYADLGCDIHSAWFNHILVPRTCHWTSNHGPNIDRDRELLTHRQMNCRIDKTSCITESFTAPWTLMFVCWMAGLSVCRSVRISSKDRKVTPSLASEHLPNNKTEEEDERTSHRKFIKSKNVCTGSSLNIVVLPWKEGTFPNSAYLLLTDLPAKAAVRRKNTD